MSARHDRHARGDVYSRSHRERDDRSPAPRKRSLSPQSDDSDTSHSKRRRYSKIEDHGSDTRHGRDDRSYRSERARHNRSRSRSPGRQWTDRRRRSLMKSPSHSPPRRSRRQSYTPSDSASRTPSLRRRSRSRSYSPPPQRRRADSRSTSPPRPVRHPYRDNSPSRSRSLQHERRAPQHRSPPPRSPVHRSRNPLPSQAASFHHTTNPNDTNPPVEKEKVNWYPTGLLAAETNTVQVSATRKVTLKYNEPPNARKPPSSAAWRLYIFRGAEAVGDERLSARSCWLIGRDGAVADLPVDDGSVSKQHAVVQFRYVEKEERNREMGVDDFLAEFGDGGFGNGGGPKKMKGKVLPYLLDLESANGTYLNGDKIGERRFVELRNKDMVKFGLCDKEFVLMKE